MNGLSVEDVPERYKIIIDSFQKNFNDFVIILSKDNEFSGCSGKSFAGKIRNHQCNVKLFGIQSHF